MLSFWGLQASVHIAVNGREIDCETGIGSVVVAENILLAVNGSASDWVKRGLAVAVLAIIATIHIKSCALGVKIMVRTATGAAGTY